jgi:hypothetical protein
MRYLTPFEPWKTPQTADEVYAWIFARYQTFLLTSWKPGDDEREARASSKEEYYAAVEEEELAHPRPEPWHLDCGQDECTDTDEESEFDSDDNWWR